jgi:hypothetical protein
MQGLQLLQHQKLGLPRRKPELLLLQMLKVLVQHQTQTLLVPR